MCVNNGYSLLVINENPHANAHTHCVGIFLVSFSAGVFFTFLHSIKWMAYKDYIGF